VLLAQQQPTTPTVELPPELILLLVGVALLAVVGRMLEARARTRRREARERRQREYRQYLRSEGWMLRRQVALDRARGFCEDCGARGSLDVHHRTYKRKGNERPEDLVAVCRRCHKERHAGKRTFLDVVALALLRRWRIWRYRNARA
jgi:5-methylcytosine-specific restriction endonuclease McrA